MSAPILTDKNLHKPVSNLDARANESKAEVMIEKEPEKPSKKIATFSEKASSISNYAERERYGRIIKASKQTHEHKDASFGSYKTKKLLEVVIDDDDREQVTDVTKTPWRKIAALRIHSKNGNKFVGTGWFIGPGILVTAGHCVFLHDEGGWPDKIEVIPALDGIERPYSSAFSTKFESNNGWVNDRNSDYDYGVILLDEPLGEKTGWFSFAAASDSYLKNNIANISGYPADRDHATKQYYHSRNISRASSRRIYYEIDTYGGQSGSPMWMNLGEGDRVAVGIHTTGNSTSNCGTRITDEVFKNLKQWKEI